ncbi:Metallo-hydrolase/oxidoreductase [Pyrenochaeta sp. DS3sAY3a]|nr:Metallo-hydrolase/oxidoreductase [Pyrenochaeta sp. DS3sAY3a]
MPSPTERTPANVVQLHLLDGGSLSTADISMLHANAGRNSFRMYDWCFLVVHKPLGRRVLWDVGISSDTEKYTPFVLQNQFPRATPVGPRNALEEQLKERGIKVDEIDTVIFSHAHWDHCRPVKSGFPAAKGLFGPELSGPWVQWGHFEKAMDLFGDGSFWVIQAPGHMPGNLCAAAWVEVGGQGSWIILASDCCHSRKLLDGQEQFAQVKMPAGKWWCLHTDVEAARDIIARLKRSERDYSARIAMTHDADWIKAGSDLVLMSMLGDEAKREWPRILQRGEAP